MTLNKAQHETAQNGRNQLSWTGHTHTHTHSSIRSTTEQPRGRRRQKPSAVRSAARGPTRNGTALTGAHRARQPWCQPSHPHRFVPHSLLPETRVLCWLPRMPYARRSRRSSLFSVCSPPQSSARRISRPWATRATRRPRPFPPTTAPHHSSHALALHPPAPRASAPPVRSDVPPEASLLEASRQLHARLVPASRQPHASCTPA